MFKNFKIASDFPPQKPCFFPALHYLLFVSHCTITPLCDSFDIFSHTTTRTKYKREDYVIHKMSHRPTYKNWGVGGEGVEIHKSFSFTGSHTHSRAFSGSAKTSGRKYYSFPLCGGSGHFDMLICSFQTAGICTCINSDIFF